MRSPWNHVSAALDTGTRSYHMLRGPFRVEKLQDLFVFLCFGREFRHSIVVYDDDARFIYEPLAQNAS